MPREVKVHPLAVCGIDEDGELYAMVTADVELDGWVGVELIVGRVGVGSADVLIAIGCGEGVLFALLRAANLGLFAYMLSCEVAVLGLWPEPGLLLGV